MNKRKLRLIILISSITIFIIAVVGIGMLLPLGGETIDRPSVPPENSSSLSTSLEDILPNNPIDFNILHEANEDIYAWIKIPTTNIDYPILQNRTGDVNYYVNHDQNKKRTTGGGGAIFTQRNNSLDFNDPNTLIYGHHNGKGDMFTELLKFKDEAFFNATKTIYIYTPGHILTYEIFAAYLYDDRHILNAFNFRDDEVFSAYLESCLNPKNMIKNVREGVMLTTQDRIITLSTCNTSYRSDPVRYLVQGVLRNDERTK